MASKAINAVLNLKDNFSKVLRNVSQNTKEFQRQMRATQMQGKQMRNSISNAFSDITKAAGVAGVAGMGAFAATSVKTFAGFEQSMSNVEALLGKSATPEILQQLGELAEEMGAKTSKSAKESADALGYMALAGWDVKQMTAGLEPILRLSEAGNMDLARASDLVTDSMSAMGITMDESGTNLQAYLDKMAKAQASSNTTADQMMEAYLSVGGMFKNFKTPVEESSALLGILANRGIKGAEAGNSLNSVLINLMGTSSATSEALKVLGVSAYDQDGNFRGVETTLKDVGKAMSTMNDEQRDMLSAALGGKTQIDTLNALISGLGDEYDDLKAKIVDSNGALNDMAKTAQNNLIGKMTALKSAFEGVQIKLAKKFQPALMDLLDKITTVLPKIGESIGNFLDWFIQKLPTVISLFKTFEPVIIAVGVAFASWMVITKIMDMWKKAKGAFTALKGLGLLTNPIFYVAVAIGVVVAALVHFYKTSESFRNGVHYCLQKLKEFGAWLATFPGIIKNAWTAVKDYLGGKMAAIGQKFMAVKATIKGVIDGIIQGVFVPIGQKIQAVINTVKGILVKGKEAFVSFWQGIFTAVSNFGTKILAGIKAVFSPLVEYVKNAFAPVFENLSQAINGKLIPLIGIIKTKFAEFKAKIVEIATAVGGFFVGAFNTLVSIFQSTVVPVINAVKEAFSAFWNGVLVPIGNYIATIFVNTFVTVFTAIRDKVCGVINFLVQGFMNVYTSVSTTVMNVLAFLQNIFVTGISTAFEFVKNIIMGAVLVIVNLIAVPFANAFETAKNLVMVAVDFIAGTINNLITIFGGVIDFITGVFTGNWSQAWNGVVSVFKGIFQQVENVAKSILNSVIGFINGIISGINKVSSIEIAGKSFGFTIPEIPKFATGTQYFTGGLAQINEHGGELVNLPNGSQVIPADKTDKILSGGKNPVVNITIQGNVIGNQQFINEMGEMITSRLKVALCNV